MIFSLANRGNIVDKQNQSNDNSSQNELDLGLNHSDAITPRKRVQSSDSIFDKAKGLLVKKNNQIRNFMFVESRLLARQQVNIFHQLKHFKVKMLNSQRHQVLSELKSPLRMFR